VNSPQPDTFSRNLHLEALPSLAKRGDGVSSPD